jgi:hypothetical protein
MPEQQQQQQQQQQHAGGAMHAPPPAVPAEAQPTLRVMRLFKPKLANHVVLPGMLVSGSGASSSTIAHSKQQLKANAAGDFSLGSCLQLPDSFGEHLTCYAALFHVENNASNEISFYFI